MSEVIKINGNESTQSRVPNSVLEDSIESIKLFANRGNSKKEYSVKCDAGGMSASYTKDNKSYSVDISWEFLHKVKELIK